MPTVPIDAKEMVTRLLLFGRREREGSGGPGAEIYYPSDGRGLSIYTSSRDEAQREDEAPRADEAQRMRLNGIEDRRIGERRCARLGRLPEGAGIYGSRLFKAARQASQA